MTRIISIEGSSFDEKLCVFVGLKALQEKGVHFLEDFWELPDLGSVGENYLDNIVNLTHFTQNLYSIIQKSHSVGYVVTFFSPFTVHQYCKMALTLSNQLDSNRILYRNLAKILEDDLLQRHTVIIYLSPYVNDFSLVVEEKYLLEEGRTLLRYRPLFSHTEEIFLITKAILNYIGFVNLPGVCQEKWLTQRKAYKSGVNYGKVKFFNKFGTVSYKTFYSGNSSFPFGLSCFTTIFHQ